MGKIDVGGCGSVRGATGEEPGAGQGRDLERALFALVVSLLFAVAGGMIVQWGMAEDPLLWWNSLILVAALLLGVDGDEQFMRSLAEDHGAVAAGGPDDGVVPVESR